MSADDTKNFTIEARPGTDIWKKPPSTNIFDGQSTLGLVRSVARDISPVFPLLPSPSTPLLSPSPYIKIGRLTRKYSPRGPDRYRSTL